MYSTETVAAMASTFRPFDYIRCRHRWTAPPMLTLVLLRVLSNFFVFFLFSLLEFSLSSLSLLSSVTC